MVWFASQRVQTERGCPLGDEGYLGLGNPLGVDEHGIAAIVRVLEV